MNRSGLLFTLLIIWLLRLGLVKASPQSILRDALTVEGFNPFHSNSTISLLRTLYNLRRSTGEPLTDEKVLQNILSGDEDIELIQRTEYSSTDLLESEPAKVVIIGAGPAGLLNAITARSFDLSVTVVEKRPEFTRDVWMDLYGPPLAHSLPTVEAWGLSHQEVQFQTHPDIAYAKTFRLQILQRFLSKVAAALGVNFVRAQYSGWCKERELDCQSDPAANELPFDVLVGADGLGSLVGLVANPQVRQNLGYQLTVWEKFKRAGLEIPVPGLSQRSLIFNFIPEPDQPTGCPEVQVDSTGQPVDGTWPCLIHPEVTSVFKRFYHGHCHLQVLFSESAALPEKEVPWELLRQLVNSLLAKPHHTVESLLAAIAKRSDGTPDVEFVPIRIRAATGVGRLLVYSPTAPAGRTEITEIIPSYEPRLRFAFLVGDATITAHYRLGVGLQNAFAGLAETESMWRALTEVGPWAGNQETVEGILLRKFSASDKRLQTLAELQLSTIWFESRCDYVVRIDLYHQQEVYEKRRDQFPNGTYLRLLPLSEAIARCLAAHPDS